MKKEQPECRVDEDGAKRWFLNGELHREDGPAVEIADGNKYWFLHGEYHREDGPAVEWANGDKEWWLNDQLHREDGPAYEYASGRKEWFLHHKEVHPEQIVDLHLMRGTFCYYNEETETLHFAESK